MGCNWVRPHSLLTCSSQICCESDKTNSARNDNIIYTHRVMLDVRAHLFGHKPTPKQDVDKAVLGIGAADNQVVSKDVVFPLFVCDNGMSPYTYLGNYTATKLDTVAWEELSEEVRLFPSELSSQLSYDWYSIRGKNSS